MPSDNEPLGFGPWAVTSLILVLLLFFGFLIASQTTGWKAAVGISGLIFLSSATVGALLGFIFAVPRVIARQTEPPPGDRHSGVLSSNTNLERISDWLSTMLVGVGLSQLTNLNGLFVGFRTFLAQSATVYSSNGQPSSGVLPAVGPFILVIGAGSGFLFMYLMTRLVLVGFFRESEDVLSGVAVAAIRVAVSQTEAVREIQSEENDTDLEHEQANGREAAATSKTRSVGDALDDPTAAAFVRASHAKTLSSSEALEIMFQLLYEPGGYRQVIQMSGELSRTAIAKRGEYWFYLAAAFGQQMQHTEPGSDDRQSARDNALDAARRAVRIDRSFRRRLWEISNPNSTDNDLSLLREDPEFQRLTGQ